MREGKNWSRIYLFDGAAMLEFVLFSLLIAIGTYAIYQRNGRIYAEARLRMEHGVTATLGRTLAQVRTRCETAERALADCGGPGPRSTIRRTS